MPAKRFKVIGDGEKPVAIEVLKAAGWTQIPSGNEWDLCWNLFAPGPAAFKGIDGRRFNHLIGSRLIGIKDGLHKTLAAAAARLELRGRAGELDFVPRTFLVPEDEAQLLDLAARSPHSFYIEKPRVGARGEGVRLLAHAKDGKRDGTTLIQEYLARPHLIDGYKYSMRFYVLLTSVEPMVSFVFDDGFIKFASQKFSLDGDLRKDRFRHLTNPDVLQHDKTVPVSSRNLTHRAYREQLAAAGADVDLLWRRIHRVLAKTIAAGHGPMVELQRKEKLSNDGCFEMFGFDIMLDAGLRPHLIEVNISPSLAVHADTSTPKAREEAELKTRLLQDMFRLIDLDRELGDPPKPDASVSAIRRYYQSLLDRRGGFAPLLPGPDGFDLLPMMGACAKGDFALSLGERGGQRPLRPARARAFPLDRGLVVQADDAPSLLSLDADVGTLWGSIEGRRSPDRAVWALAQNLPELAPAAEELVWTTLAAWAHDRVIEPADAPEPERPAVSGPHFSWNRERHYELDGFSFVVRIADEAWDPMLLPTLAALRCPEDVAPAAAFDVRIANGTLVVEDERGYRITAPTLARLPAALHEHVQRRSALHAGYLGSLDALVVESKRKHSLILGAPRSVAAKVNLLTVEPALFVRGRALSVRASHRPVAAALPIDRLITLREDPVPADELRAALLAELVGSRIAPVPPLSAETAAALTAWLQAMSCEQCASPEKLIEDLA